MCCFLHELNNILRTLFCTALPCRDPQPTAIQPSSIEQPSPIEQPFRSHVPMDKTAAKQTWNTLAKAIDEIYNRNASQLSFEELYRNAYNLVLHKHGTLLYEGVTEKINSHLTEIAEHLSNVPSNSLLEELSTTWTEHEVSRNIMMETFVWYCVHSNLIRLFAVVFQTIDYNDNGSGHSHVHG